MKQERKPFFKKTVRGRSDQNGRKKVILWVASKKSHADVGLARWQGQATVTWHLKNFSLTSAKRA